MSLPFAKCPLNMPLHKVFPAEYAATRAKIISDFATIGTMIVGACILLAVYY